MSVFRKRGDNSAWAKSDLVSHNTNTHRESVACTCTNAQPSERKALLYTPVWWNSIRFRSRIVNFWCCASACVWLRMRMRFSCVRFCCCVASRYVTVHKNTHSHSPTVCHPLPFLSLVSLSLRVCVCVNSRALKWFDFGYLRILQTKRVKTLCVCFKRAQMDEMNLNSHMNNHHVCAGRFEMSAALCSAAPHPPPPNPNE